MQTTKDMLKIITEDTAKLRAGKLTPEQANAIARLTQVYINILKLEITAGVKIKQITK